MKIYKQVMIEKFIAGREIQVAIMGKKKLGAIELKPKRKFYDYQAKYNTKAKTQHIIPVELSKSKLNEIISIALKAHNVIGCKGVTRSDFKFYKNKFYLLEINTQPGMTKLSLVPEIAQHAGISFHSRIVDRLQRSQSPLYACCLQPRFFPCSCTSRTSSSRSITKAFCTHHKGSVHHLLRILRHNLDSAEMILALRRLCDSLPSPLPRPRCQSILGRNRAE